MSEGQSAAGSAAADKQYHSKLLEFAKAWLSVLTVASGALWGLYQYIESEKKAETTRLEQARSIEQERVAQSERENTTRRIEAQKPFLELQFKTYLKTTTLVGQMILLKPTEEAYKALRKEFDTLYWAELALVEDPGVSTAMVQLQETLGNYERGQALQSAVRINALLLAHAMRDSIPSAWQGRLPAPASATKPLPSCGHK